MEKKKAKRIVLGEGEIAGHKHILESSKEMSYNINESDPIFKTIDFELKTLGVLTHDEHAKMVFEAGQYRSYNQVEWNPFDKALSRVFD